jgi:hypothetical protein
MTLTSAQAQLLKVKARTQLSPYLEKCCLLVSANEFYERSAQDIPVLTGMEVSRGTQQRLVHRQDFGLPTVEGSVTENRHRIINYSYFQAEGISIGSGSIESTVKQIGARLKLLGAQWESSNVPQVFLHRCAYLNGQFSWSLSH